jgi:alcohol dehydrogenase (cytochrome c)
MARTFRSPISLPIGFKQDTKECAKSLTIKKSLLAFALCIVSSSLQAQTPTPAPATRTLRTVPNFVGVTDQTLRAPKPEDWLTYRGNYQSWGYSPLAQINKTNVKTLQLVWARAMEPGINQATPLVYNGVMFLGNPNDVIQAIDAANGDLLWEYRHPLPPTEKLIGNLGQRKRSIALYGDHVRR